MTVYGRVRYSWQRLPDIPVELYGADLNAPPLRTTTTDADGAYAFASVAPGNYHIKVIGGEEYIGWTAQSLYVGEEAVHHPVQLAKNIVLLDPANGSTVSSIHPTLTWTGNPEADADIDVDDDGYADGSYTIQINETDGWAEVEFSSSVTETNYTVQSALTPGVEYTWQVDAYDWWDRWVGTTEYAFTFTPSSPVDPDPGLIDFEHLGDGTPVLNLTTPIDITTQYSAQGLLVSFVRSSVGEPLEASLCDAFFSAREGEGVNHSLTAHGYGDPCGGWSNGDMTMTFAGLPTTVSFLLRGPDSWNGFPFPFLVTAYDAGGANISNQIEITNVSTYDPPNRSVLWREETQTLTSVAGISRIKVSHVGRVLSVDNLTIGS